jgi:F1F0 ATPase subunit 2
VNGVGLIVGAFASGMGLGAVFFGGLWWTVSRTLTASTPAAWIGISALLRMAIVVSGLYCFACLGLPCLIACLCGLLAARGVVTRVTRMAG